MTRRILVTSALPYANGHIHIGHLVEYLQTDMWVRFQRLRGHRVIYMCADDTHGTAIMMRAQKEGKREEDVIAEMSSAHQRDFAEFEVAFDHYGSTNSEATRKLCHEIWASLRRASLVKEREVTQLFDTKAGVFLADRFVKGRCPRCGAPDQYGDSCDKCGSTYSATELLEPVSALSQTTPEIRKASHLFVEIEALHGFLEEFVATPERLQAEVANYLKGHFLSEPLRDWDVSRPAPYFGFEIPDAPGHYWYVWFDAPVGYLGATAEWCEKNGESFDAWWRSADTEVHHFIGKDITYFHTLFWPAMLQTAGLTLPTRVQVHGFLTVNGEKMSKSKGTFVLARTYLDALDPAYLRYYYASKLGPRVEDLDIALDEFVNKVNSDLVGKVVNLASRTARFVEGTGLSKSYPDDGGLFAEGAAKGEEIAAAYEVRDFAKAMRIVMGLADRANEYVDRMEPWKLKKDPARGAELQAVCSVVLNLYRQIIVYLAPVLPKLARDSAALLNAPITRFEDAAVPLCGTPVAAFSHLMQRVDPKKLESVIELSRETPVMSNPSSVQNTEAQPVTSTATSTDDGSALAAEPLAAECSIEDFQKVDLRIARIVAAEHVPEAKKLLKLTVSLGGEDRRTIFAGIKAAYAPEALVGRLVVVVANLAPRKMKFGVSEGMVAAAGSGGDQVFLLSPDAGARPGHRLH
ncbi:MAG TPA: methionine--tRNA ligase [Polyangiaceae bacterium]|nr:methionine--tRNA ligase [Polyangiaceae bacterium]